MLLVLLVCFMYKAVKAIGFYLLLNTEANRTGPYSPIYMAQYVNMEHALQYLQHGLCQIVFVLRADLRQ